MKHQRTTDIVGRTFGRWTVLGLAPYRTAKEFYECRCKCGTYRDVRKDQLTRGVSKSCGCLKAEIARNQIVRLSTTHGMSGSTTHEIWKGMRKRCNNSKDKNYKNYGGRGIRVCARWDDFAKFLSDMGERPKGMTIERIDNDGNYEPKNCRWASQKEQANNKREGLLYRIDGEIHTLSQWCEKLGIPYHRAYQRIFRLHWTLKRALTP